MIMVLLSLLAVSLAAYLGVTAYGNHLRRKGQKPFDPAVVEADGGRYARDATGRAIEYFVFGSDAADAPVIVALHGSGPEARCEARFQEEAFSALGVKGVAISLPGYGHTDEHPGRVVKNWPREDLAPVLEREGVDRFMVMGHSQGTVHAMAAAWFFPDRCVGMGLNAPLLPRDLSKELGLKGAIGSDGLHRTEELRKPSLGWYWTLIHVTTVALAPALPLKVLKAGMRSKDDPEVLRVFGESLKRSGARGANIWETALDVCYEWGFDPREIQCANICVWHAADDSWCPPEIGKWLANYFAEKGARVNARHDDLGYNHLTYVTRRFLRPEASMAKALLDGFRANDG